MRETDDADLVAALAYTALEWALRRRLRSGSWPTDVLPVARQAVQCCSAGHNCGLVVPPALRLDGEEHVAARDVVTLLGLWPIMPCPEPVETLPTSAAEEPKAEPLDGRA